jgi:hypothetical protein
MQRFPVTPFNVQDAEKTRTNSMLENKRELQWGKKVFSQPPIVQVLPLQTMREACNFHHRYTSTMIDKMRKKIQKITLLDF